MLSSWVSSFTSGLDDLCNPVNLLSLHDFSIIIRSSSVVNFLFILTYLFSDAGVEQILRVQIPYFLRSSFYTGSIKCLLHRFL